MRHPKCVDEGKNKQGGGSWVDKWRKRLEMRRGDWSKTISIRGHRTLPHSCRPSFSPLHQRFVPLLWFACWWLDHSLWRLAWNQPMSMARLPNFATQLETLKIIISLDSSIILFKAIKLVVLLAFEKKKYLISSNALFSSFYVVLTKVSTIHRGRKRTQSERCGCGKGSQRTEQHLPDLCDS